jgi:hypothetical protein
MEEFSIKPRSGTPVRIGNFEIAEVRATQLYFETKPTTAMLCGEELKQTADTWKLFDFLYYEQQLGINANDCNKEQVWEVLDGNELLGILRRLKSKGTYLYWKFKTPLLLVLPIKTSPNLCGKMAFATLELAMKTIHDMPNRDQRLKQPVRAYFCPVCNLYHLTSIPSELKY